MRLQRVLAVAAAMAAAALCWAAPPRLVRSEPASGARNVALDAGLLRMVFDQDMKQNQWTLMRSARGEFPPTEPGGGGLWVDARTFEMRLGRMKPGATYAVQLNSDRRQGFRSAADDAPLPVTVIVFTTLGGGEPAAPAVAAPDAPKTFAAKDLEGVWSAKTEKEESTLKLLERGRYESQTHKAGETAEAKGTWRVSGAELICQPDGGADPLRRKIESLGKDALELMGEDGQRVKYARVPSAAARQGIVGSWLCVAGQAEIRATFGADGRCSYAVKDADGGQESAAGVYRFEDGALAIRPDGQEESLSFTARLVDDNTLDLTDTEGNTARLIRQGVAAPAARTATQTPRREEAQPQTVARQLVGAWALQTEDGELQVVFGADGRCSYVQRTADGEARHEAAWRLDNGVLEIRPRDGQPDRLRIRFPSPDVMEMVGGDGSVVILARQRR